MNKQKYYYHGKFFDTFEEMVDYAKAFPEMPFDIEYFKQFLNDRYKEAEMNNELKESVTNRFVFKLLRKQTDWVTENDPEDPLNALQSINVGEVV
jgi:hypothetical protein